MKLDPMVAGLVTVVSTVLAVGGFLVNRRKAATDGAGTLVHAGIELATYADGRRVELERQLSELAAEFAAHKERVGPIIDGLQAEVADCHRQRTHDRELLLIVAKRNGIDVTDLDWPEGNP